jgi:hypothetical protein
MMPDESEIDEQVRQCVAHCLPEIDPVGCVRNYVSRLVLWNGWAQPDANLVAERAVLFIAGVLQDESILDD